MLGSVEVRWGLLDPVGSVWSVGVHWCLLGSAGVSWGQLGPWVLRRVFWVPLGSAEVSCFLLEAIHRPTVRLKWII